MELVANRGSRSRHRKLRPLPSTCCPGNEFGPPVSPSPIDETWLCDNLNQDCPYHLPIGSNQSLYSTTFDLCSILHCLEIDPELKRMGYYYFLVDFNVSYLQCKLSDSSAPLSLTSPKSDAIWEPNSIWQLFMSISIRAGSVRIGAFWLGSHKRLGPTQTPKFVAGIRL